MIQIQHVSFEYANAEKGALYDVSLEIRPGECVLLCGESGCGKTTITRLLNGLIPHFYEGNLSGSIRVNNLDVRNEELYTIARTVGSVFQNPRSQFFCLDTTSELAFGCENMGLPKDEILARIDQVTRAFHLKKCSDAISLNYQAEKNSASPVPVYRQYSRRCWCLTNRLRIWMSMRSKS